MWPLLLAADAPVSADPTSWIAFLTVVAPLSGFATFMWWMEHQRAIRAEERTDTVRKLLDEAHQREIDAQKDALPMLTRAVDVLAMVTTNRDHA